MRSLFHFPLPCTTTLAATVSYSNRPTAARNVPSPASCTHAPPAPLPSFAFRRPPAPRSRAYRTPGPLSPAPRAPAMPRRRPCLAPPPAPIAPHHLSTAPLPPTPIGLASSASRPPHAVARIASTPLRAAIRIPLCRHRADSALIAPPHHDHRAPPPSYTCCASPSASRPPCADIRVTPPISLLALRRPRGPGWQEPRRMHPFFAECAKKAPFLATSARNACFSRSEMATSSPHASISGRNRAIRDTWRANLAAKGPFPRRGARNHAWREDVKMLPAPPGLSRGSGMRSGRTGFAPCGSGPAARGLVACALRPVISGLAAAARAPLRSRPNGLCRRLACAALRRPRPATRSPHRCISLPARRTHPASRAHPPRPGNKRNNANNSMRA